MGDKKGGKKNRKLGRNENYCKLYTAADLWAKNQKRRIRRHLLSHPNDKQAIAAYEKAYGDASGIRVMVKGKATDRTLNATGRHKKRRREDTVQIQALANARTARRYARKAAKEKQAEQDKPSSSPAAVIAA